jgi:hypothetical protein
MRTAISIEDLPPCTSCPFPQALNILAVPLSPSQKNKGIAGYVAILQLG